MKLVEKKIIEEEGGGGGHFCENFDALILDALGCLFKITIFKFDRKATQCN